ncbi:MAG: hypothetical protein QXM53_10285 [Thermofilaceae archaeon]
MSYVRYLNGNLTTFGEFCLFDGVSRCVTALVVVSGGNLTVVEYSVYAGDACPGHTNVVLYGAGNLSTTSVSTTACYG